MSAEKGNSPKNINEGDNHSKEEEEEEEDESDEDSKEMDDEKEEHEQVSNLNIIQNNQKRMRTASEEMEKQKAKFEKRNDDIAGVLDTDILLSMIVDILSFTGYQKIFCSKRRYIYTCILFVNGNHREKVKQQGTSTGHLWKHLKIYHSEIHRELKK